jgi:misacylated tRNA(Ala) deacylase
MTEMLFREDAYASSCNAQVIALNDRGGLILDRTIFYATSGGQPGDRGTVAAGSRKITIATAVYGADKSEIVHVPAEGQEPFLPGEEVELELDWRVRHAHMRVHTALHLLCALVRFPVTGGQIAADGGRLDFDIPDPSAVDRNVLQSEINRLIQEDHPVFTSSISDEELLANPDLVRTMAVKPPMGAGKVRLVGIGEGGTIDLQPCGGTHVRSTGEIGHVSVGKLESKGKQNRRIRIMLV